MTYKTVQAMTCGTEWGSEKIPKKACSSSLTGT